MDGERRGEFFIQVDLGEGDSILVPSRSVSQTPEWQEAAKRSAQEATSTELSTIKPEKELGIAALQSE